MNTLRNGLTAVPYRIGMRGAARPRVTALVDRILDRHARTLATIVPVGTVLRKTPPSASFFNSQRFDIDASLRLAFVTRLMPALRERVDRLVLAPWRPAADRAAASASAAPAPVTTVFERLFTREQRIDVRSVERTVQLHTPAASNADGQWRAAPPMSADMFVMRRSVPVNQPPQVAAPAAPKGRPLPAAVEDTRRTAAGQRSGAAAPIPLSPSDLNRLTDDVVRAIDRRVVSYRERRGEI